MFCCPDNGIFIADDKRIEHLDGLKGVWDIVKLAGHEDVLLAGTYSGLYLLVKKGTHWRVECRIQGFPRSCKDMLPEKLTANTLWIANKENGVSRVTLSEDLRQVK